MITQRMKRNINGRAVLRRSITARVVASVLLGVPMAALSAGDGTGNVVQVADATTGVAGANGSGSSGVGQLQSITVTASKRREEIKDIPTSVSAIDGDSLLEHHIANYDDITRTVPGVSFQAGAGPGLSNIEMRGVSSTSGAATVGIYIDEVSVTVKNTYDGAVQPKLFDVDRVEILRGPQGTLFGSSSMGGTIRFITKQPDLNTYSASGGTDLSGTRHGGFNNDTFVIANVPVIPGKFALRFGADVSNQSGYIDHYIGTQTGIPPGGNPANGNLLTLNTNDSTGVLGATGVNSERTQVFRVSGKYLGDSGYTIDPSILYQRTATGDSGVYFPSIGQYQQDKRVTEPTTDILLVPSLTITKALDFADLTSVTSFFRRDMQRVTDGTYYNSNIYAQTLAATNDPATAAAFGVPVNPLPASLAGQVPSLNYNTLGVIGFLPGPVLLNTISQQFSQELRLTSKETPFYGMPMTWTGGLYVSNLHQEHTEYDPIPGLSAAFAQIYNAPGFGIDQSALGQNYFPGVSYANDMSYFARTHLNERQLAPFGEFTLGLTDKLKAAVGLRYVSANQSFDAVNGGFIGFGIPSPYKDSGHYSATTPKASLDYAVNDRVNVYTSAAKGFRLGGPSNPDPANIPGAFCNQDYANLGIPGAPTKYDSDSLWSYEVGTKGRYFDNRLSVNAAMYAINWSNIQQSINLPFCGFTFTANAGDARSLGTELEVRALVTDSLTLGFNGGTSHAYITRSSEPAFQVGEAILNVPEFTANFSADYDTDLTDTLQGFARADYAYTGQSHAYYNSSTVTNHFSPSYGVLNLAVGVVQKKMSISLYAKNLLDNKKIIQYPSINTVQEGFTLRPLTVGLTATFQM